MLLDKLLSHVNIRVEPFAMCLLNAGWRLQLPAPSDTEFHFVLQGSGILRGPDGQSHALQRYFLAVVPKGAPHSLESGEGVLSERVITETGYSETVAHLVAGSPESAEFRVACGIVHVTLGDSLGFFRRLGSVIVADLSGIPQVRSAFEALLAEQGGVSPGSGALTQALMSQCLVYLLRFLTSHSDGQLPWLDGLEDQELSPAVDAILDKPAASHTVSSLAEMAVMSRSQFARRFQEAFACSPISFVHDVRLRQAAGILSGRPELTIDQVARRVGFRSRSHFSRAFKQHFGVSPLDFRQSGGIAVRPGA